MKKKTVKRTARRRLAPVTLLEHIWQVSNDEQVRWMKVAMELESHGQDANHAKLRTVVASEVENIFAIVLQRPGSAIKRMTQARRLHILQEINRRCL